MAINAKKSTNGSSQTSGTVKIKAEVREKVRPSAQDRAKPAVGREDLERQIRDRAYYLFLNRRGSGGNPEQDWYEAERQVKKELRIG